MLASPHPKEKNTLVTARKTEEPHPGETRLQWFGIWEPQKAFFTLIPSGKLTKLGKGCITRTPWALTCSGNPGWLEEWLEGIAAGRLAPGKG